MRVEKWSGKATSDHNLEQALTAQKQFFEPRCGRIGEDIINPFLATGPQGLRQHPHLRSAAVQLDEDCIIFTSLKGVASDGATNVPAHNNVAGGINRHAIGLILTRRAKLESPLQDPCAVELDDNNVPVANGSTEETSLVISHDDHIVGAVHDKIIG